MLHTRAPARYRPQHICCTRRVLMTETSQLNIALRAQIRGAFLSLAETLERLPTAWDSASLCEAWRVRDVVAHMSAAARYLPEQYRAEIPADGGDLNRTIDRIALRDGDLDPQ